MMSTVARRTLIASGLGALLPMVAAADSVSALSGRRRILRVSAPNAADPRLIEQRRIFEAWGREAADRDVSLEMVTGAFQVWLIGKDGHVALRSSHPVTAAELQSRIDAMPMRRAGGR